MARLEGALNERLLKRIPKFIGEAEAWPAFKHQFQAYVNQVKGQPSFAYYDDLCTKLDGEALDDVKGFAAQIDNSYEAAVEKLGRWYGEFESERADVQTNWENNRVGSANTQEMRELEDYLRSAIGIFGRKLVRNLVISIVAKFTEPLRKEWKDRIRPLASKPDFQPEEELIKFLSRQRLNVEFFRDVPDG